MQGDDDEQARVTEDIINRIKVARLGQPYSLVAPKPFHFPRFSRSDRLSVSEGLPVPDPQLELLYSYGMPCGLPQSLVTYPGIAYGSAFSDFTLELFGLKGEPSDETERLGQRHVGQVKYASVVNETLPMRAGLAFTVSNPGADYQTTVLAWRWRVFMDDSSLCLENLWHNQSGWIPFVLGIKYDNPEKMVADAIRFAPAFRLCNLIDARLGERRGGRRNVKVADLSEDVRKALGKRYVELKDNLRNVKRDAKAISSTTIDWKLLVLNKYHILKTHSDLFTKLDPYDAPSDADASDGVIAPWEIAIEIAARETIPGYEKNGVSSDSLKKIAMLPSEG